MRVRVLVQMLWTGNRKTLRGHDGCPVLLCSILLFVTCHMHILHVKAGFSLYAHRQIRVLSCQEKSYKLYFILTLDNNRYKKNKCKCDYAFVTNVIML